MANDEHITRLQHYVPKSYLQFFSNENRKTYAYFYSTKQIKHLGIDKLCCQSYLYEEIIQFDDAGDRRIIAPNEIEESFISSEGIYASIVRKVICNVHNHNEARLSADEVDSLKSFLSLLVFRAPHFIHILNCFTKIAYEIHPYKRKIKTLIPDFPDKVLLAFLAHNHLDMWISGNNGILPNSLKHSMDNSQLCILRTTESCFITSDMPVINIYGESNGIDYDLIGMPITPELFLAFVDIDVIIPKIVTIDATQVASINSKQIRKSTTILISSDRDTLSHIDTFADYESADIEDIDFIFETLGLEKESTLATYDEIKNTRWIKYWSDPYD